jgi:menaquinone reductase, multiheme cytochrome c subunit
MAPSFAIVAPNVQVGFDSARFRGIIMSTLTAADEDMDETPPFTFPRWSNKATLAALACAAILPIYLAVVLVYGANPTTLNVGYAPEQPVPYSHALHAGKLGIDCRYCHSTVERAAMAALPPTDLCMNCHKGIFADSAKLAEIRHSYETGEPVRWLKIHDLPDYVYFNHSAHLNSGVGCVECHGPIHQMEVVQQEKSLSMAWCVECHRSPAAFLRPRDKITVMDWAAREGGGPSQRLALGERLQQEYRVEPNTDCVSCHR